MKFLPIGFLENLHAVEFRTGIICGGKMSVRFDDEESPAPVNGHANFRRRHREGNISTVIQMIRLGRFMVMR